MEAQATAPTTTVSARNLAFDYQQRGGTRVQVQSVMTKYRLEPGGSAVQIGLIHGDGYAYRQDGTVGLSKRECYLSLDDLPSEVRHAIAESVREVQDALR